MLPPPPGSTRFPYTTLFRSPSPGRRARRRRDLLPEDAGWREAGDGDRKRTRLNSSHLVTSYAVFCLTKKSRLVPGNRSRCIRRLNHWSVAACVQHRHHLHFGAVFVLKDRATTDFYTLALHDALPI